MKTAKRTLSGVLSFLICIVIFQSCDTPSSIPKVLYKYYIDEYYYIESINRNSPVTNPYFIAIHPESFLVYSETENKTKYKQTGNRYGDNSYNRELDSPKMHTAYCNEFIRFDVISDTDFDEAHPAGTSLGDIAQIIATSPYKYIKSGYKDEYDWESLDIYYNGPSPYSDYRAFGYHPVRKMLSELTPEDMLLLYPIWFKFIKEPTVKGTHRMTVILEDKEKEMTCQFDYIFE